MHIILASPPGTKGSDLHQRVKDSLYALTRRRPELKKMRLIWSRCAYIYLRLADQRVRRWPKLDGSERVRAVKNYLHYLLREYFDKKRRGKRWARRVTRFHVNILRDARRG